MHALDSVALQAWENGTKVLACWSYQIKRLNVAAQVLPKHRMP